MKEDLSATVIISLEELADPDNVAEMTRVGISTEKALGIKVADLHPIAAEAGIDHDLALGLWDSEVHEARISLPTNFSLQMFPAIMRFTI